MTDNSNRKKDKARNYVARFFSSSNLSINRNDGGDHGNKVQIIDMSDGETSPLTSSVPSLTKPYHHNHHNHHDGNNFKTSLQSIPSIINRDFTLLRPPRTNNEVLLQGPRRILRLCIFVLVVPMILISVPLYARFVLYPPWDYPMAPTDQKLLNTQVSSFWCQGLGVKMNGSFNAYLMHTAPRFEKYRKNYTMLHHLNLKDDVKEYWGFYFTAGSTITLSSCTRYDGGQLMILRGVHNLRKCAWIGENDSSEEVIDTVIHNEDLYNHTSKGPKENNEEEKININKQNESTETDEEHDTLFEDHVHGQFTTQPQTQTASVLHESLERQLELDRILKQAILLSKNEDELLQRFHKLDKKSDSTISNYDKSSTMQYNNKINNIKESNEIIDDVVNRDRPISYSGKAQKENFLRNSENHVSRDAKNRLRRSLHEEDLNDANEDMGEDEGDILRLPITLSAKNLTHENQVGTWMIPKGLRYDQGIFNQTNEDDNSFEEYQSSFSSSEEALASCKGVILALPLVSDMECVDYKYLKKNHMSYKIPISGTYYFVFSSDNEVFMNDLYFNLTMQRVVYDTEDAFDYCLNETDCSLPLEFMSRDQTVVEVLENNDWTSSYLLHTSCEPRVTIYLTSLLLVPILILFCALR